MEPGLPPGSWLLVVGAGVTSPKVGQVVVAEHPDRPGFELIKRVSALSRERGLLWLAGDNPWASTDSDEFGPVPIRLLRGVALLRLKPTPWRWLAAEPDRIRRRPAGNSPAP